MEKKLKAIEVEVSRLNSLWRIYKQLFLKDEATISFLTHHARYFFYITQKAFLSYLVIGISKLTDPLKHSKYLNFSFEFFLEAIRQNKAAYNTYLVCLKKLQSETKLFRSWRNKYYAHFDAETVLSYNKQLLPNIDPKAFENVICQISDLFILLADSFQFTRSYSANERIEGDGDALIKKHKDLKNLFEQLYKTTLKGQA